MHFATLPSPLFAGIEDWLELLVPAVFVIIWVISQIAGGMKPAARPPRRVRPAGQAAPAGPGGPAGNPGGGGGLAGEIEEFLRKVQNPEPVRQPEVRPEPAPVARPREPVRSATMHSEIVEAELVEPERKPSLADKAPTVGRQTQAAAERLAHLSSKVDDADEQMQEHVHEVFDHQLGQLYDTSDAIHEPEPSQEAAAAAKIPSTADSVRDMLASPDSVRKAVVLSEILSRRGQPW